MTITGSFERIQYFNFETNFWKTQTPFKKLKYRFLVESTKINSTTFSYKTALPEAKVTTNRMENIKWIYHKERNFTSNYFLFSEILFQFKNLVKRVNLMYQLPKNRYSYSSKVLEFYLRVIFAVSTLKQQKIWLFWQFNKASCEKTL